MKTGTVVSTCIPFGDKGINETFRCSVLSSGIIKPVFMKIIPEHEIAIEYICANIGRTVGLPIPEPIVTICDSKFLPSLINLGQRKICFSSIDVGCPSFLRTLNNSVVVFRMLLGFDVVSEVSAFDEWIINTDRHPGNILFDGGDKIFFIDHGFALKFIGPVNDLSPKNQVIEAFLGYLDKIKVIEKYNYIEKRFIPRLSDINVDAIFDDDFIKFGLIDNTESVRLKLYLRDRIPYLSNLINRRFDVPQMELPL